MSESDISSIDVITVALAASALALSLVTVVFPWMRRPRLSLAADRQHSHVERAGVGDVPYLRLPVRNGRWTRSATRVRVVLDGYRRVDDAEFTRLGSPFLAWPSTFGQESDAYVDVLFSGTERPVGVGRFQPMVKQGTALVWDSSDPKAEWHLQIQLPGDYSINDQRDLLPPGHWEIVLVVGAEEGDARRYALKLKWGANPWASADDLLSVVLGSMSVNRL